MHHGWESENKRWQVDRYSHGGGFRLTITRYFGKQDDDCTYILAGIQSALLFGAELVAAGLIAYIGPFKFEFRYFPSTKDTE